MFWKLSFRQPCAIDTLLEKEDCTLDEILDDDNVLQECKSNNKKLTDFLVKPDVLEQLVRMVCFEPADDAQDKVKFKYPHLACELLTSEVFIIVEQLSTSEHLMNMLWEFLDSTTPLNPLLGSYISKVLSMLLNREANVVVRYIKSKEDFISKFLSHLGTSAIMDLLLQMVTAPVMADQSRPVDQTRIELAEWLLEERIVERLVDFIKDNEEEDSDGEQCVNSALTLCEMVRLSRECFQLAKPAPLHEVLESKEIVERLLKNMFAAESPSDVVVVNGISVLLTMLKESLPTIEYGVIPSVMSDPGVTTDTPPSPGIANVVNVVVPWLKEFHSILTRKPEVPMVVTTVGILDPPLGNMRLQVVKLLSALLARNSPAIAGEVVMLDMFSTLIDLFFSFPWNNFLHMQVELCVHAVLESPGQGGRVVEEEEETKKEGEEKTALRVSAEELKSLRMHLLKDCQFVSKLLEGASANETANAEENGRRQGYMGHLVRISNNLVKFGETDEQLTVSLDDDTQQRWNNFVNGPLAEMNKRNETNLGGKQPMTSNMDDSDDEFDQLGSAADSELEKVYQQYLDVKYTGSYLEEYGVEDELCANEEPFEDSFSRLVDITRVVAADEEQTQPTSLFEAVCLDRIQQFDDEDSDDDYDDDSSSTWVDKDASLSSPMDQHNDSIDDSSHHLSGGGRAGVYLKNSPNIITQITSSTATSNDPDKMEIENSFGVLSWKSDLTTDEDLSGGIPMDTGSGITDWTKEPDNRSEQKSTQNSDMWADFSKFPASYGGLRSTQSKEEVPPTHSHITVTYITRDMQNPTQDEDFLEPAERPDASDYSALSPYEKQRRDLDEEGDNRCSDSDEEDLNTSSDSDEERSGNYTVNTSLGSDSEQLIGSLNDSREQEMASSPSFSSSSPSHSVSPSQASPSSPSSREHDHHSPNGKAAALDSGSGVVGGMTSPASLSSRHAVLDGKGKGDNHQEVSVDAVSSMEGALQDNYMFLSKQGMLSKGQTIQDGESRSLLEQKRAEALEACSTYDNEVKVTSLQQDSIET